jgi:hypothetical protein
MDKEYLERLRAQAAEVRADLAEREANETIMPTRSMPAVIHKTIADARVVAPPADELPPEFSDDQLDIIAGALAEIRQDFRDQMEAALAPIRERVAFLEGQLSILLNPNSKTIEASEVVRKLHVTR